jgi:NADPH:quinone reductase-like Zn-dependent oxidoreductase
LLHGFPVIARIERMRALLSHETGGPELLRLDEVAEPVAGPGELLVRVRACAINYPDHLVIRDEYQIRPSRPFAPGTEVAGEVEAVGEGVTGWSPGDRVIALPWMGGLQEKIAVPAANCWRLPDGKNFAEASALVFTYGTALYALERGELRSGEVLLVLGAAGGVGLAGVELGKALGARVIAAVSSDEKAAVASDAGADRVLIYPQGPFDKEGRKDLANRFKAIAGEDGADVIYDPVGGDYAEAALRSIAWLGRFLVVGFPAGVARIPLNLPLLKGCDIRGIFWGRWAERDPNANHALVERLVQLWSEGKIRPRIGAVYPLERAAEAIAAIGSRQAVGKLVVEL